ncbi:MAG: glycosyltransferase family 4 protein [Actinomycetota bacterium]|nr:glycosyltransferase family 4 protein [Actinomycetota bacterium]
MRVVVVGPYPPRRDGVAAYVSAQVDRLRSEGHEVTVISPTDGNGDIRVPFRLSGRPFREAAEVGEHADRIDVHFQPSLYYRPRAAVSKVRTSLALLRLCRSRSQTRILVHEADRPKLWRPDYAWLRAAFRAAPVLLFHTASERAQLERDYHIEVKANLVDHREGIRVHERLSRKQARKRLGIPLDEPLFVSAGFLHPDKGYDRAIEAVHRTGAGRLVVLGSVRQGSPTNLEYARRLRELAGGGVEVVERYLAEEELDLWTTAADAVVLPYRRSWSSGALARAQAIGTPAIVTAVGGLAEQATERDLVVDDDDELDRALRQVASSRGAA